MSELKKKCRVLLLPTEKAENCIVIYDEPSNARSGLMWKFYPGLLYTQSYINSCRAKSFHMYILSDDEIKEGDLTVNMYNNTHTIFRINKILSDGYEGQKLNDKNCFYGLQKTLKKVIASTDRSLWDEKERISNQQCGLPATVKLPSPSEGFINKYIESYNKGRIIEECMVEYAEATAKYDDDTIEGVGDFYPKVRKDNSIIISEIKDSWSREEVKAILIDLYDNQFDIDEERKEYLKRIEELL